MSQEEFDREKYSHLYRLLKKPENLLEQANIYEYEIFKKHYSFDRAKTEMETLQLITKTDVIQFYYVSFFEILFPPYVTERKLKENKTKFINRTKSIGTG